MEAVEVDVRYVQVRCCAKTAPCPTCGRRGRRKQVLPPRQVRTIAYKQVVYLEITAAEYYAKCDCCKTFRSHPEGVEPRCHYDNRVRQAVLARIVEDGMSIQSVLKALKRDFLLNLSEGFVYDCLHRRVEELDMAAYRQWTLEHFSGTLCVDELHLGRYTLLLATDPLADFPVAFALVAKNDQPHMERFLTNLKRHGFSPQVVISDGSDLYPAVLAKLWPEARHQLCVFHVQQDINDHVLDAVKRMRRQLSRRGNCGRRRKRGRPNHAARAYRKRRKQTLKEKAHFVFKHRYLLVTREEKLTDTQRKNLRQMFEYVDPEPATHEFCVFKSINSFTAEETPNLVAFFARPEVLAGLHQLATFVTNDPEIVASPWSAACGGLVAWPLHYLSKGLNRAVLGGWDPSARKFFKTDELSFTVPFGMFTEMINRFDDSFLKTDTWENMHKKIARSKKAWGEIK